MANVLATTQVVYMTFVPGLALAYQATLSHGLFGPTFIGNKITELLYAMQCGVTKLQNLLLFCIGQEQTFGPREYTLQVWVQGMTN